MSDQIRIALPQINTIVGDLKGNSKRIIDHIRKAEAAGADIVLFPELTIPGYPPEDLILKQKFIVDNKLWLERIAKENHKILSIVGFVDNQEEIYNSAALLYQGKIAAVAHKICLPNYSVFDEMRYFAPGKRPLIFEFSGIKFGVNVCEDIWVADGVTESQGFRGGAEIILSLSASPYFVDKRDVRLAIGMTRARTIRAIVLYNNLVGGQDELVFDGNGFVIDHRGEIITEGKQFEEDFIVVDLDVSPLRAFREKDPSFTQDKLQFQSPYEVRFVSLEPSDMSPKKPELESRKFTPLNRSEEIYRALVLGTKDYVTKNGFEKVVIGLSGGIDSALTAAIAVDALGSENVVAVILPSEYTSETSMRDANAVAEKLGIHTETIPIQNTFKAYLETLKDVFRDHPRDVTEENLQARIRGNILMALSNKFGWLVLTTGNKSETSVGYCTLYGDMAGGFAVIKDVPKTMVYKLCEFRNQKANREVIPKSILTKPPTAELRAEQKDEDILPPYDVLDPILEEFVERDKSVKEIIEQGYPREVVIKVAQMVDRNEYKRRQAPPGIKITQKAFGKDRRVPITNQYHT
ncbi:NAD+ synthase [candidate division KSB1 bacterium]|nr:NAD+ synthase [candidate division KSB1 bacterium]NIR73389.1 NAD+ synthase [candidate division KSB1 bacterium]NIS28388.1 NAD+ synthase [candidate division KSB1 bacterium]NIT75269.1 NAD+ synthase [candidate division KSB1 bacterium]NIU29116.1 NAD+ synthase [candidate division KSB1 bacterium]